MIKSLLTEYGLPWVVNRSLYSAKLKMMRAIPSSDRLFEKKVQVKRIDIFNLNSESIERFLNKLSEDKKSEIIMIADNAARGKIQGFSSLELNYGNPINWHLNPITKKEVSKSLKWYQIPDFDPERGDIKIIWEASRFTHFFYFIRAYMLTKDKKYYEAFSSQLGDWLQENKYPLGAHYKCGQEATLRMINTLIAFTAFKSYGLTAKNDEENTQQLVEDSYKKVLSNFFYAYKCIKNNHTLSEITGLIIGAWACGDDRSLKHSYMLLDQEIQNQFLPDGGYLQYSLNYQRFALQLMEFNLKISSQTKIDISEHSKELIKNSANLIYQMQAINGDVPNYGSNDGALIFPVTSCGYRDFRPVINTIHALIDKVKIYKSGDYEEELLWFGKENIGDIQFSLKERKPSSFTESGFYSLRHNEGFLMTVLQDFKTRPAQMDQLHIDLWHKGVNVFCDSGTYSYATEIGKKLALTSAHNTVKISETEQMNKRGPFLIYDWTRRGEVIHTCNSFIGTMLSQNGYNHTRKIKQTESGYLITDEVIGNGEECKFYFHTPCNVKKDSEGFELYYEGELICKVKTSGVIVIEKANRSLYYLKKEEINSVTVRVPLIDGKCRMDFKMELNI